MTDPLVVLLATGFIVGIACLVPHFDPVNVLALNLALGAAGPRK